ncbi:hypothetical protein B1759_06030 [Rubrivirga sp. SAORIC476]|uniref:histidine phosphatase family protein n=1 Tax=Rubrivirga sp. SAORIC476 TaxID=1961794 RepID=UPI000BA93364|nr:histidine phosphatase family protein [Rubrivirga sp. SAORIC476]PAP80921.1 hypothetical protein B1759_06030 [Rubrivirga sp. SAORIC476]
MLVRLGLLLALLVAGCAPSPSERAVDAPPRQVADALPAPTVDVPEERIFDAPPTRIYFVRHAEKATAPADDPPLTEAGETRAEALVEALGGERLHAIYSSQFARTRATAAPIAAAQGREVTVLPIEGPDTEAAVRAQARQIAADSFPYAVLVVGHSNTIPHMISELTGEPMADLGDFEYDGIYVVTISEHPSQRTPDDVRVERRRYGAPNPE